MLLGTTFPTVVPDQLYSGPTVGEWMIRSIKRYADRIAFVFEGRRITYRHMGKRVSQLMQVLRSQGLKNGDGICLFCPNRPEAFLIRIAANLLGLRFTALHPLGSLGDHAYIFRDSQSALLIIDRTLAARGAEMLKDHPGPYRILSLGECAGTADILALADRLPAVELWCEAAPSDVSCLVYSGGTTGRPKGIIHSLRTLLTYVLMCLAEWEWPKDIRLLAVTPLSHAAGMLVLPTLVRGGTVYLKEGFDAEDFLRSVEEDRITVTFLVPTMLYVLLDHALINQLDHASLQLVIYGASPISPSRLLQAMHTFGPILLQLYAQSEAPMTVTTLNTWDHDPGKPALLASCGYPMVGVQVCLLDADGNAVRLGEVGEICVRGPLVMDGYWNRPAETAEAFTHGWLHTGDLARQDQTGALYIVDRKKDMIVTGGFNVYPKEVEDVLVEHPAVAQAAVISVPDEKWGEALKAVIVRKIGSQASEGELQAFVRARKGPVLTPKSIEFRENLPLTQFGKPDKKNLRAPYWKGSERNVN